MILRPVLLPIAALPALSTRERVAEQSRLARIALTECARLSGGPASDWNKDANGAPSPNDGWHWSIAHSREWAAAVISREPVGIDVERIRPRREGLFDQVAGEDEWNAIGGRTWNLFFRMWTAKEAVLKANRAGIGWLRECRVVESGSQLPLPVRERAGVRVNPFDALTPHPASPLKGRGVEPLVPDNPAISSSPVPRMSMRFRNHKWQVEHHLFSDQVAAITCDGATVQWTMLETPPASSTTDPARE